MKKELAFLSILLIGVSIFSISAQSATASIEEDAFNYTGNYILDQKTLSQRKISTSIRAEICS